MQSILFLCHRLPWPPSKGDKIRSFHVLHRLAKRYRVYLGTFVDNPDDWQYVPAVKALCAGTCIRALPPWQARLRALTALARGEPLTVAYYRDRCLRRWIENLLAKHQLTLALCYSSGTAPYLIGQKDLRRVMDFVDVDSDKWRQYAQSHRGITSWLYWREARRLAEFERRVAARFDASLFVSEAEAEFFRDHAQESADKIYAVPNGVDSEYWNPERNYPNPYPPGTRAVVFVGAMDYWANVDAAQWFAREIWPTIHAARRNAHFYIVGTHPTPGVQALEQLEGITVTGQVEDVRPYLAYAHAVVAPLRVARGIQNKVLEALAMAKVLLATPAAYEGIDDFKGRQGCISDSVEIWVEEALQWLDLEPPLRVTAARDQVLSRYPWARALDVYEAVLDGASTRLNDLSSAPSGMGSEAWS